MYHHFYHFDTIGGFSSYGVCSAFLCRASAHQRSPMARLFKEKVALKPFISNRSGLRPSPSNISGCDRPWLGELEPSGHQKYPERPSGAFRQQLPAWTLCVFILGFQLSKQKTVECFVQHHSSTQTTCRVFLAMFCAFLWLSSFIIQLVLRRKNIQSLASYTEKRSLSFIVWSPVRIQAMVIFGARYPGAYLASGTNRAFTAQR